MKCCQPEIKPIDVVKGNTAEICVQEASWLKRDLKFPTERSVTRKEVIELSGGFC